MNNPNAENTQQNTQNVSQPVLEMSALIADLQHQATTLKDLKAKKGPSTPESKERVKYNPLRHGFTGQVLIMTPEEHEKFAAFVKGMMIDLAPVGTHEAFLANSIAEETCCLNQIRRKEISFHGGPKCQRSRAHRNRCHRHSGRARSIERVRADVSIRPAHPKALRKVPRSKKPACSSNCRIHRA